MFVELTTDEGLVGLSEVSQTGADTQVIDLIRSRFGPALIGTPLCAAKEQVQRLQRLRGRHLVLDTVLSGLDTALFDVEQRASGVPFGVAAASPDARFIPLYANVNRSIGSRSPEHFARVATEAVEAGFSAVKCAPFDEFRWTPGQSPASAGDITPGLQRVRAIRAAVGPGVILLVDCHKRLSLEAALAVGDALTAIGVGWLEEPFPPHAVDLYDQLRHRVTMTIAGGEDITSLRGFRKFLASKQADVVMPDIKYCGLPIARAAARAANSDNRRTSLHSPSGPISTLVSGHVTADLDNAYYLEYAFGEVPWRSDVITPGEVIEHGALRLPPGPGLGIELNESLRGTASGRIEVAIELTNTVSR